jgi:hypothetical protein
MEFQPEGTSRTEVTTDVNVAFLKNVSLGVSRSSDRATARKYGAVEFNFSQQQNALFWKYSRRCVEAHLAGTGDNSAVA